MQERSSKQLIHRIHILQQKPDFLEHPTIKCRKASEK